MIEKHFSEMRWISWGQKPAWFNNTCGDRTYAPIGYTPQMRELVVHGKQRFTICTCVDSGATGPPPVGVLFKASNKGAVWRELTALPDIPAWMHLQTQEKGSYRAEDMLELLEKFLPDVSGTDGSESQIIQLDWYAAHPDARIQTFIKSRGHVLLLHGGGTTDYEQVNDTHLHARLQSMIKSLEIGWNEEGEENSVAFQAESDA